MKEMTMEEVAFEVTRICDPHDIISTTLPYSTYSDQKQSLLTRRYSMQFALDLAWLYDPDSWRQDLLPQADWDSDYKYVVLLEGDDPNELSRQASAVLLLDPQIGLVISFY